MRAIITTLLVLMLAGACATPAPLPSAPEDFNVETPEYRLGSADRLRVTVYGEDDLSGEYVVDGTGMVSLPLVGEVSAGGLTLREFQRAAEEAYEPEYLLDARISAEVLNFRPYYILGEVNAPGTYPYSDGLTVLNAVASAQGFTYRANQQRVRLKRAGVADFEELPLTSSTQVRPGDTILILERYF